MKFSKKQQAILDELFGVSDVFGGAYSVRVNGESFGMHSTSSMGVAPKKDKAGIDVVVLAGTKGNVLHVPVILSEGGIYDEVYNDFYVEEGAEVLIVSGCGIHSDATHATQHDGVHVFHVGVGAKVRYLERHYGAGDGGAKVLNPKTVIELGPLAEMEIETVQIEGVDRAVRETECAVGKEAKLIIVEKILTDGSQTATTKFRVDLDGRGSRASVASRSVARGRSRQEFRSVMNGNNECAGHSECDAIIMDEGYVKAVPDVTANHAEAQLIHEAAIGRIAGEQIMKLQSMGLRREEAERRILQGFLR